MFSTRLKKLLEKVILSLVFWITIPILGLMLSPFYLFRAGLKLVAKRFHPDWEIMNVRDTINHENVAPLTNPDDELLNHDNGAGHQENNENENGLNDYERQPLTNIMILGIVAEGDPHLEKIRNFFRDYVLNFKNYKGELLYRKFFYYYESWFGYSFWRQAKDFRIEHHIRYLEEFDGKPSTTQEELEVFLGDYNTKSFPWKSPPWELLIIKNFVESQTLNSNSNSNSVYQQLQFDQNEGQDKKFVLIFRWQRGIADGHSIFKIFVNIFGGEANTILSHIHTPEQSLWTNLKFYLSSCLLLGYNTIKLLAVNCDQNIWRISDETLLTGTCQMVTTKKLPYNVARTISKKRGVSVTSVLFTAVAGALRQYFIESGQERRIPKCMRVRVAVPFGAPSHTFSRLTNNWSFDTIKLPVGISDPSVRLHKVDHAIETVKKSLVPGFLWLLGIFYGALPHCIRQLSVHDKKTTLNSWYFAGPKEQLLLFGEYPGLSIISFLPRLNTDSAIGLTVFSYNGTICYTLCIDKALFSDRESAAKMAHLIEKNFFALQDLQESAFKVKS